MDINDLMTSADTAQMQGGGKSFVDQLGDAATAGVAGATASALTSFYNTGVDVANVFGADMQRADTAGVLNDINQNWGAYYKENQSVLDTVGFIGGSFIPGGIALKGLQLARRGEAAGAFVSALRYTTEGQSAALRRGMQEIAAEGGTVFARLNANKLTAMAFGAADQVLQTAVFETAAAATMHASPFFANDSYGDIVWDITKTSLTGGLLGGGVEALFTNRIFRDTGQAVDKATSKYAAVAALDRANLTFGDKVFDIIDQLGKLPAEVQAGDRTLTHTYTSGGQKQSIDLDIGGLADRKLQETSTKVMQDVQAKLTNIVSGDTSVGKPVADALVDIIRQGGQQGVNAPQVREKLSNYLLGLKNIEGMGSGPVDFTKDVLYFTPGAKITGTDDAGKLFSTVKTTDKDSGYRINGNIQDAKLGVIGIDGVSQKQMFADGFDGIINHNQTVNINPDSEIFRPVNNQGTDKEMRTIFNTRTQMTNDSAIPTIGDVATQGKPLQWNGNGVSAGQETYSFTIGNYHTDATSMEDTARHLWASQLTSVKNVTVDSTDFSVLDRMIQDRKIVGDGVSIKMADGTVTPMADIPNFQSFVTNQKLEVAQKMFADGEGAMDPRTVAYKTNSEVKWIQDAATNRFDNTQLQTADSSRALESYKARENVVMVYDKSIKDQLMKGDFPTGQLAFEYRKQIAVQKLKEASAAVLGADDARFLDLNYDQLKGKFDGTGVGATAFGSANANYGDIGRVWAQDTGKSLSLVGQKWTDIALDRLQAGISALIANPKAGNELAAVLTKVRRSPDLLSLLEGRLVDLASKQKLQKALETGDVQGAQAIQFKTSIPLSDEAYGFLQAHHELHQDQLAKSITLANAQGTALHWNPDALYLPPIDTKKFPFFAFVRPIEGQAFSTSETAMITARNPTELEKLAGGIDKDTYQVIYKGDTEAFHKANGDYDYARALNQPTLDPFLRKQGKLGDFLPSLDGKAAIEDFVNYHTRKSQQLVRDAVEVKNAQTMAELKFLSDQTTKAEKSKFSFLGALSAKNVSDPYGDYIKTALNVSKKGEYTLWSQANEFVDSLGTRAYQALEGSYAKAKEGGMSWEDGNALMNRMGLDGPFTGQQQFLMAQTGNDRNLIKQAVAKGNMLLSTFGLRLDAANSLLNVVSTPILLGTEVSSIRSMLKTSPELMGKLNELTSVVDPVTGVGVPSTTKLLYNAVHNFFTPEGKDFVANRGADIGVIKGPAGQLQAIMADLQLTPNLDRTAWAKKVGGWTDKLSAAMGNNFAEDFTRFVSADVMRQMTDPIVAAGKMSAKEQNAYMSIFVNRVQGNYIASQRPIAFQGTIGAAVGLFQTYQFNLFQQLFRHIENRDAKTIAVMAGLQTATFGLNGLPLFDAINTHLIGQANINTGHQDAYSFAVRAAGKPLGDWAMYGTPSAFPLFGDKMPALYTRGDINPRQVTVLPTSWDQVPATSAASKVIGTLVQMGKQLGEGNTVANTLMYGLEHNGISRPLAGIAQSIQGFSTTSAGSLIGASSDFSAIATASRILGAKPMDEAVALNTKFRLEGYQAADRARQEDLGTVIRQRIRDGNLEPDDIYDFQTQYAARGGRVDGFGAAMQRWTKGATTSVVNTLADQQKTAAGQRLNEVMGGGRLGNYSSSPVAPDVDAAGNSVHP